MGNVTVSSTQWEWVSFQCQGNWPWWDSQDGKDKGSKDTLTFSMQRELAWNTDQGKARSTGHYPMMQNPGSEGFVHCERKYNDLFLTLEGFFFFKENFRKDKKFKKYMLKKRNIVNTKTIRHVAVHWKANKCLSLHCFYSQHFWHHMMGFSPHQPSSGWPTIHFSYDANYSWLAQPPQLKGQSHKMALI